jgi:hypothetical protein
VNIRQKLEQHQLPVIAVAIAIIVGALVLIFVQQRGASTPMKTQVFFTVDDGATLFTDDSTTQPPFDYNGKQAVRAFAYTCDGGSHRFVQYLMKFRNATIQRPGMTPQQSATPMVKKPGQSAWIDLSSPKALAIYLPVCPAGDGNGPPRAGSALSQIKGSPCNLAPYCSGYSL